jgi:YD repeat-containing protein
VEDNAANTTNMTYDWLSRKITMDDPDMGHWSYEYDANGNLRFQTDAKGQTIEMVYDNLNRLTDKIYPVSANMTDVKYLYDQGTNGKGRRTFMSDTSGNTTYTYDERGRLVSENRKLWGTEYITLFTYDSADRLVSVIYPSGENVTQGYNGRSLPYLLSGDIAGNIVNSTLYNALGMPTEINLGNGLKTTYAYWGIEYTEYGVQSYGRLYEIKTLPQAGGTTLQQVRHTWDDGGNLVQRDTWLTASSTWEYEYFTYDFLDRLVEVSGAYSDNWTYSSIGNILTKNGVSYTYPTNGVRPHAVTLTCPQ